MPQMCLDRGLCHARNWSVISTMLPFTGPVHSGGNRKAVLGGQPQLDELAAAKASLTAQLQAMQDALMGKGHDLSSLAVLKVWAARHDPPTGQQDLYN
jgi:hypothetical protein